jgi:type IV secretion system protein VirD4
MKNLVVVAVFIVSVMIGMALATQYVAGQFEYNAALGNYLFLWENTPVYAPYKYFSWFSAYSSSYPGILYFALTHLSVSVILGGVAIMMLTQGQEKITTHGSAEWAQFPEDYRAAGLIRDGGPSGIFIGQNPKKLFGLLGGGEYLTDNENTHVLLCAPTRSGKGVSTIIPTLLTWEESLVINDVKGELWKETAWTRKKMGHIAIQFNPVCADDKATSFNPLDEIRIRTVYEMRDVSNITEILVDPTGEKKNRDFWDSTAKAFITAVLLHLKYIKEDVTFTDVSNFMRDPAEPLEDKLMGLINYPHDPDETLFEEIYRIKSATHPEVAMGFRSFINTPDDTRGGILKSAETFLDLFVDPLIRKNTSRSGFKIKDLMYNDNPVSLYISIPVGDISRLKPLLRLLVVQIIGQLTMPEYLDDTKGKHKLLLLLDELPQLGKLSLVPQALAYIAQFGIRGLLIIQSINQLREIYGHDNQLVDGCHTRIFHAPNEDITGKYISDLLGQTTVETKSVSYSGFSIFAKKNVTVSHTGRALMMSDEIRALPMKKQIIFVARSKHILTHKICYYEDRNFTRRIGPETERLALKSDILRKY